jgi:hypothetical protein
MITTKPAIPAEGNVIEESNPTTNFLAAYATKNDTFKLPAAGNVGLNPGIYYGKKAEVFIEPAATAAANAILVRYWLDGSLPDIEKGIPIKAGEKITIEGNLNVKNARFISVDGLLHILQIQYYN